MTKELRPHALAGAVFQVCEAGGLEWVRGSLTDPCFGRLPVREQVRRLAIALIGESLTEFCVGFLVRDAMVADVVLLGAGDFNEVKAGYRAAIARGNAIGATALYASHNHPIGNLFPSAEDLLHFLSVAALMPESLPLVDEVVVSGLGATWIRDHPGPWGRDSRSRTERRRHAELLALLDRVGDLDARERERRLDGLGVPRDLQILADPDCRPEGFAVFALPPLRPRLDRVLGWSGAAIPY